MKMLLLPGMDGTTELFAGFLEALPDEIEASCVAYPRDSPRSYRELTALVQEAFPRDEPFVIVAESYSTPVAVLCGVDGPENLRGIVLCAGFVASPLRGSWGCLARVFAPMALRLPLPRWAIRRFLVGGDAEEELVRAVRQAISGVSSEVLCKRFLEVLGCDVREALARIQLPVLSVRADKDRLLGSGVAEEILRVRPGTIAASLDGPHLLLQRCPGEAAEVVRRFLLGSL